jgi:hypothetical protein
MRLLDEFNVAVVRDGITLDNCGGVDLGLVRERISRAAEQIRLAEVYGQFDDDDWHKAMEEER